MFEETNEKLNNLIPKIGTDEELAYFANHGMIDLFGLKEVYTGEITTLET